MCESRTCSCFTLLWRQVVTESFCFCFNLYKCKWMCWLLTLFSGRGMGRGPPSPASGLTGTLWGLLSMSRPWRPVTPVSRWTQNNAEKHLKMVTSCSQKQRILILHTQYKRTSIWRGFKRNSILTHENSMSSLLLESKRFQLTLLQFNPRRMVLLSGY